VGVWLDQDRQREMRRQEREANLELGEMETRGKVQGTELAREVWVLGQRWRL
jgi:hypothetical protein